MFDYMGALSCLQRLCPCGQRRHQHVFKSELARQPTAPKLSGSEPRLQNLELIHQQHAPEPSGTHRNSSDPPKYLPEPASITKTSTRHNPPEPEPSGSRLQNLHKHAPEPSETETLRNLPEPSGTNLPQPTPARPGTHQYLPKPFGTFRNLPPEPTTARVGTFRNLPLECASLPGLKPPLAYGVGGQF